MYETSAKSSTMPTGGCSAQANPPLAAKCHDILDAAVAIDNVADTIRGKLFGQQPQDTPNGKEPYSIEDTLMIVRGVLQSAYKTLQEINERT